MRRDPLVLTFVFVFPIVTMLIIGGAFGTTPDHAFDYTDPSHWYVASYLTVVIGRDRPGHDAGSPGLLPGARRAAPVRGGGLPALVVRDRRAHRRAGDDRGGLRAAAGGRRAGLRAARHARRLAGAARAGPRRGRFIGLGVLLGSVLPSARSAQAVGLVLFFPSFLLGAGGPPPHVMGSAVRAIAGPLPLTLLTNAVREPWLGLGPATTSLIALAALTVVVTAVAARRAIL